MPDRSLLTTAHHLCRLQRRISPTVRRQNQRSSGRRLTSHHTTLWINHHHRNLHAFYGDTQGITLCWQTSTVPCMRMHSFGAVAWLFLLAAASTALWGWKRLKSKAQTPADEFLDGVTASFQRLLLTMQARRTLQMRTILCFRSLVAFRLFKIVSDTVACIRPRLLKAHTTLCGPDRGASRYSAGWHGVEF